MSSKFEILKEFYYRLFELEEERDYYKQDWHSQEFSKKMLDITNEFIIDVTKEINDILEYEVE